MLQIAELEKMIRPILIRTVEEKDLRAWERMRQELWPSPAGEHAGEIARFFAGDRNNPMDVLIACATNGEPTGFVELAIRPYAEGCYSGRVAYIEGWFVDVAFRKQGVGTALMKAAEDWGRVQGCTELASDVEIENKVSIEAHRAIGFTEIVRSICFRKEL